MKNTIAINDNTSIFTLRHLAKLNGVLNFENFSRQELIDVLSKTNDISLPTNVSNISPTNVDVQVVKRGRGRPKLSESRIVKEQITAFDENGMPKRRPGRPRKTDAPIEKVFIEPKKRGRPPKNYNVDVVDMSVVETAIPSSYMHPSVVNKERSPVATSPTMQRPNLPPATENQNVYQTRQYNNYNTSRRYDNQSNNLNKENSNMVGYQNNNAGNYNSYQNNQNPQPAFQQQNAGYNNYNNYNNNGNANNAYNASSPSYNNYSKTYVPKPNYFEDEGTFDYEEREGVLEILPDGYGFLRAKNFFQGDCDAFVPVQKIKRGGLRKGDYIVAKCRKAIDNRPMMAAQILSINGVQGESFFTRPAFETLTPVHPDERYKMETPDSSQDYAIRAIDLIAPIGKGQRAMIVSPPKAGKTTFLKKIAKSIVKNYPKAKLYVLLIDERPEEVTDMERSIQGGEVVYSTFDELPERHTKCAELVIERAKRLVELGEDVIILMDSLTRLTRANNLVVAPSGRLLSGGIDPSALHFPKKFFGAARKIENGGSLTIVATTLIDTGSRMDDVIYEEFKGTGNSEIHLDRKLSEKRIFPAIDLGRSSTRREELLLSQQELDAMYAIRKILSSGDIQEGTENLFQIMSKSQNNRELLHQLKLHLIGYKK